MLAGIAVAQQPVAQPTPRPTHAQPRSGINPAARPVVTPQPAGRLPLPKNPAPQKVAQRSQPQANSAPLKAGPAQNVPQANGQQPFIGPQPAPTPVSLEPMRPADMPPVPPQVTYRDGMLTVQALNCTMASLLQAIRNKTGIQFEGAEFATGRVAISLGPAPEADVLAGIFGGSPFDYVMIGREDSPSVVQRVILTPKKGPGAVNAGNQPPPPAQPQAQPNEGDEEQVPDEQASGDVEPQDTPAQPPDVNAQQNNQQNPDQSQPKTPEQLLQELKEMQQRQAEQQGQTPPNPGQVPRKPPR